jgi:hypothetical protein
MGRVSKSVRELRFVCSGRGVAYKCQMWSTMAECYVLPTSTLLGEVAHTISGNFPRLNRKPDMLVIRQKVCIRIREALDSNPGHNNGCPDWGFTNLYLVFPGKCCASTRLGNDHFLPNPFQLISHSQSHLSMLRIRQWRGGTRWSFCLYVHVTSKPEGWFLGNLVWKLCPWRPT